MRDAISSYKNDVKGRYHRHHKEDWTSAQMERRAAFNEAACVVYLRKPRKTEGAVHLIIGDSLVRCSSDGIQFERTKGVEQGHSEANQQSGFIVAGNWTVHFGPPPGSPFFPARLLADMLGGRTDFRDSSASNGSRQPASTYLEKDITQWCLLLF